MTRPTKLYKYQAFSIYAIQNLKNNHIYFNSPTAFNDPFDCLHSILYKDLDDEVIKNVFVKSSEDSKAKELSEKLFDDSITRQELLAFFKHTFSTVPDFEDQIKSNLGIHPEGYFSDLKVLIKSSSEFYKWKELARSGLRVKANEAVSTVMNTIRTSMASEIGISCFSEVVDDLLMWSYYADGHKGFCLEFDTKKEPFTKLFKVNYVIETPKLDASQILNEKEDSNELISALLATKYKNWKHEKEWRVIHTEASAKYGYRSNALTGVYIGADMDQTNLEIIALILKGQHDKVKMYRMMKSESEFKISPVEFEYHTHLEGREIFSAFIHKHYSGHRFSKNDLMSSSLNLDPNLINLYLDDLVDSGILKQLHNEFTL